ncbi:MAG: hypothetical protein ACE5HX_08625 [bacterium]
MNSRQTIVVTIGRENNELYVKVTRVLLIPVPATMKSDRSLKAFTIPTRRLGIALNVGNASEFGVHSNKHSFKLFWNSSTVERFL